MPALNKAVKKTHQENFMSSAFLWELKQLEQLQNTVLDEKELLYKTTKEMITQEMRKILKSTKLADRKVGIVELDFWDWSESDTGVDNVGWTQGVVSKAIA